MNAVVDWILRFLLKQNAIDNDEDSIEYCKYGIEITISSLLNVLLIIIIGLIFNCALQSIIFLLVFINLRRYTGGYHASTYLRCHIVLCTSFIVLCVVMNAIQLSSWVVIFVSTIVMHIFAFCIIVIFSPLENENKLLDEKTKRVNHHKSIVFAAVLFVLNLIILYYRIIESVVIALTVFLVAILMIIKIVKEGKA